MIFLIIGLKESFFRKKSNKRTSKSIKNSELAKNIKDTIQNRLQEPIISFIYQKK